MKKIMYICMVYFSITTSFAQSIDGVLQWGNEIVLAFPVTGVVQSLHVQAGEKVTKDQHLAQLDRQPFIIKTNKYKAKVDEIQPLIFDARINMNHAEELYERTVLSEVELQKAEANLKGLLARKAAAQADVALAQWQYHKSQLISPFNGVVVASSLKKGLIISEENKSAVKIIVAQKNTMQISVIVDLHLMKEIHVGQSMKVVVDGENHQGKVNAIFVAADKAGKYTVKIQFNHSDNQRYFVGQKAKAIF